MKLLTKAIKKRLPKLYETENVKAEDKVLQVKFFSPVGSWTWYGVEFDGEDSFFGYVRGHADEWGYFSLQELEEVRLPMGLKIERDMYFKPTKFSELNE